MKKLVSVISALAIILTLFFESAGSAVAVTYFTEGDYQFTATGANGTYEIYRYLGSDSEPVLPDTVLDTPVTGIYKDCFAARNCSVEIFSVTIPNSYVSIGSGAFEGCSSLISVTLPVSLVSLGKRAFADCVSLESVNIANASKLTYIPDELFQGDAALAEAEIPSDIVSIGNSAFASTAIESLSLPRSVTSIGDYAFSGCSSLAEPEFPETLESIGAGAFSECSDISEVYIPASVQSIGEDAFYPMNIRQNFTLTVVRNSYAYYYSSDYYFTNVVVKLKGDVTGDGSFNINDVTKLQKWLVDLAALDRFGKIFADANNDGIITIRDATLMQMALAGIISY